MLFGDGGKNQPFDGMLMMGYIIYRGFLKWGYAKNAGWFMMENPIYKWMMNRGTPMDWDTSNWGWDQRTTIISLS